MQTFTLLIKIISPVHVGTGEVFEPTEFFVDSRDGYLGEIDFEKFCAHLSAENLKEFTALCREGSLAALLKLYDFTDRLCLELLEKGVADFVKRRIEVCKGFLGHYSKVKALAKKASARDIKVEFNKFTIYRTAYSPNEAQPILPGSAVKGALRTAILNLRKEKAKGRSWQDYCRGRGCDSKQLESEILEYDKRKINQDPFRLLKVSDFRPVSNAKTKVVYAANVKKDGKRKRLYQIFEVVEPGAIFEGEVSFLDAERGSGIKNPVTYEELEQALKAFYGKELSQEAELLEHIKADVPAFPEEGIPLRVGRHSGAECVTIEGFRRILIRGSKGQTEFRDHATTIWLASEDFNPSNTASLKPFGWVALGKATDEACRQWIEKCKSEGSALEVVGINPETLEKVREAEEEELKKREEWEKLPEYKKMVLTIQNTTDENEVMDIYRKLDDFSGEEQKEIALALKIRWQKEGRWKVPKKRKKQYEKVQKVKTILSEV